MFTGIVEKSVAVAGIADGPRFRRITLAVDWNDLRPGESIAVNGCCLTVADLLHNAIGFDVVAETLSKTNLGLLKVGDRAHVERSLSVGDRIDGHFVQGHIDGVAPLVDRAIAGHDCRLTIQPPRELMKYVIPKGSVALDGVSLTVAAVQENGFEVALIPTTLALTELGNREIGWPLNLEADILSKTIIAHLERTRPS